MFIYKQTRFSSFKKIDILKKLKLVSVYKEISSFELPNWKAIKHKIPGEDFSAVNYPPELSPIIFSAVTEWGIINKHWL